MPYILENMTYDDIAQVAAIERVCFTMPWPVSAYKRELKTPETNRYIVVRYLTPEQAQEVELPEPTPDGLTQLTHAELNPNGSEVPVPYRTQQAGGLSRLTSLLPWRKNGHAEGTEEEAHRRFPVVGYAGLWLMVD